MLDMRRREFITLLGGAAAAWPLAARAQQGMRRVAVVLGFAQSETLARLGWSDGRNVRLDIRIVVHDCYWTVVTVAGEAGVTLVTGLRRTRCLERLGRPAGLAGLELPGLVAHDCY